MAPERRPPGRPPAKRSDPSYIQTSVRIRDETHRAAKVALLTRGERRDFSELVEDLLAAWVRGAGPTT